MRHTLCFSQRDTEQSSWEKGPRRGRAHYRYNALHFPIRHFISGSCLPFSTAGVHNHHLGQWYFAALSTPRGKDQTRLHHSLNSVLWLFHLDSHFPAKTAATPLVPAVLLTSALEHTGISGAPSHTVSAALLLSLFQNWMACINSNKNSPEPSCC